MENKILKRRKEIENLIIILIFLLFLYTLLVPSLKLIRVYFDIKKLKKDIQVMNNKIKELENNIEFYNSDEGLERWIKENFKLTNENETIFIFTDNNLTHP